MPDQPFTRTTDVGEEPTREEVIAAVRSLPIADRLELAQGPLETDDEDDCRICLLYDDYVYGYGGGPHADAIGVLISWHRWHGDPTYHAGRGPEAYRRCLNIYAAALTTLPKDTPATMFTEVPETTQP